MTDSEPRTEFYRDRTGGYRWRIRARNGRIVAESGEDYERLEDAEHGLAVALSVAGHTDPDDQGGKES